ncbi:MAG: hypothetical protein A2X82_11650 [Geobacteraceae bacterium GWC2_55_20]|nr:MAG: hypothetical protein A2X82_11650 [Geobacteraceae bacterium GWC2_55_20]OGU23350.1 MAG: hypothetical protein A2X85_17765 [Geobacteraceae bacterium GWF2_54_21]HCE66868.1 hypothetical protein [Geobacter sp.]
MEQLLALVHKRIRRLLDDNSYYIKPHRISVTTQEIGIYDETIQIKPMDGEDYGDNYVLTAKIITSRKQLNTEYNIRIGYDNTYVMLVVDCAYDINLAAGMAPVLAVVGNNIIDKDSYLAGNYKVLPNNRIGFKIIREIPADYKYFTDNKLDTDLSNMINSALISSGVLIGVFD